MGKLVIPNKIKIICGILFSKNWTIEKFKKNNISEIVDIINSKIVEQLNCCELFVGLKIDFQSEIFYFDFTDYYEKEFGKNILRYWISFEPNHSIEQLWKIKLLTNIIEKNLFSDKEGLRKVNIDPGYVDAAKLVLFTTKNYSHRIYLAEGIYAENTLMFFNQKFHPFNWTYPDYKLKESIDFFSTVRQKLVSSKNS